MIKQFKVVDLRKEDVFPNLDYRFSRAHETDNSVILERDFLGENPLHYYIDTKIGELIVANNILEIKENLEKRGRTFTWERVRAVSNNTRTTIDNTSFASASPKEEEIGPTLQKYEIQTPLDCGNMLSVGKALRGLLQKSLEQRLSTIPDTEVGLLLSGGLDSMSVGYLLSQAPGKRITAFTLKVDETDLDVVKSRELAKRFNIDLSEIKIVSDKPGLSLEVERYNSAREIRYTKNIARNIVLDDVVRETLKISGNPKRDNVLCAIAMYLAGEAIKTEGIKTVFCGEGPNEMINDYGYNPRDSGYSTDDKGDTHFREALTFGVKTSDRQLGRGGLPKHALARMGKIFAHHGLRLEAPYFSRDIARVMTRVPHTTSYDTIKQHLVGAMFEGEGLDVFIHGTSKEKFQDGSGISRLLNGYDQRKLLDMFEEIYGIKKTGYLK